jgi:hypothetical protein
MRGKIKLLIAASLAVMFITAGFSGCATAKVELFIG